VSPEALRRGLADPKDRLWEFNSILKAQDAFQQKRDDDAEALLRKVQEKDAEIYIIPFLLGEAALRRHDWGKAAVHLQRSLDLNPHFDSAMTGLARALTKLERTEEAKMWLQKALESNPQNYRAWYQVGLLSAAGGNEAQVAYEKAVAMQPNFPAGQRELGMVLFQQKNYAAAAPHLERAIELGLADARLYNFLGVCYSHNGQLQKSMASYRNAIALDANLAEAHLNLAYLLQKLARTKEANVESAIACRLNEEFCNLVQGIEK
jgi:Flp pilus assembly protein TadD